jgi:hypothetical protein
MINYHKYPDGARDAEELSAFAFQPFNHQELKVHQDQLELNLVPDFLYLLIKLIADSLLPFSPTNHSIPLHPPPEDI